MNTYHIFAIKKDIYIIYKKNSYSLYKVLYNLYNLNKIDLKYGITLYNQLCNVINIKKLKKTFELLDNTRKGNNRYLITYNNKKSLIILKPSHIIYKTKDIQKLHLYILNDYNNYLFICNFTTKKYFWIKEEIKRK